MTASLADRFLIATPAIQDSVFKNSVIYLFEHNEQGARGVIINKSYSMGRRELKHYQKIPLLNKHRLCRGGPVAKDTSCILCNVAELNQSSFDKYYLASDHLALASTQDLFLEWEEDFWLKDYLLIFGHASWSPGQLENELFENAWLELPVYEHHLPLIFRTPIEQRFHGLFQDIGTNMHLLLSEVGHA